MADELFLQRKNHPDTLIKQHPPPPPPPPQSPSLNQNHLLSMEEEQRTRQNPFGDLREVAVVIMDTPKKPPIRKTRYPKLRKPPSITMSPLSFDKLIFKLESSSSSPSSFLMFWGLFN
ncbi:hypothetical protein L6452_13440 [Arctium lappa]|uniref:Uncharacterized protein n=1 Tax=Arctium lappa TaxID=4217 RepID=A0ACB9CI70_ARCLA|nr:hypothetical protein L6452_13440 [Arctium lappa]